MSNHVAVVRWADLLKHGIDPDKALPGTTRGHCDRCKRSVAIAPATRDFMAEVGECEVVCTKCVIARDLERGVQISTPNCMQQAATIARWHRRHRH